MVEPLLRLLDGELGRRVEQPAPHRALRPARELLATRPLPDEQHLVRVIERHRQLGGEQTPLLLEQRPERRGVEHREELVAAPGNRAEMEDAADHAPIVADGAVRGIGVAAHRAAELHGRTDGGAIEFRTTADARSACRSDAGSRDTGVMPEISGLTTLVGIVGNPVSHSLSPQMQNAAFTAAGLDWAYVPLPVEAERIGDAVRGLIALGFAGANVTIPHKSAVIRHCDDVDDVAAAAGSVNTLVVRDGRVLGSSTDVVALQLAVDARGRNVLVLGRGGAARAALAAYRAQGAARLDTVSRRDEAWPPDAAGYDVIVNCTPVKDDPIVRLEQRQVIVDMAYRPDARRPRSRSRDGRPAASLSTACASSSTREPPRSSGGRGSRRRGP